MERHQQYFVHSVFSRYQGFYSITSLLDYLAIGSCVTMKHDGKHKKSNSSQHRKESNNPNPSKAEETEAQQQRVDKRGKEN